MVMKRQRQSTSRKLQSKKQKVEAIEKAPVEEADDWWDQKSDKEEKNDDHLENRKQEKDSNKGTKKEKKDSSKEKEQDNNDDFFNSDILVSPQLPIYRRLQSTYIYLAGTKFSKTLSIDSTIPLVQST